MGITEVASTLAVPMIRTPGGWPKPVVAVTAMVALAALDMLDAVLAKVWSTTGSPLVMLGGVVTSLALFWVYASSLQYADLVTVTFGWIALLQVWLVVWEMAGGGHVSTARWVAAGVIVAAEGFLLLAPAG